MAVTVYSPQGTALSVVDQARADALVATRYGYAATLAAVKPLHTKTQASPGGYRTGERV